MDELFESFAGAYTSGDGYALAQTFTPIAPSSNPRYLWQIRQSTNLHSAKSDIKRSLTKNLPRGIGSDEIKGWVDVYEAYWKALGEITSGESGKVSRLHADVSTPDWCSHHGQRSTTPGEI